MLIIKKIKNQIYSYENVRILGLTVFVCINILFGILLWLYDSMYINKVSLDYIIISIQENINMIVILMLPIMFVLTVLVMISNIKLLIKEGKTWKNMLGVILGGMICFATIIAVMHRTINFYKSNIINDYFYFVSILIIGYIESILFATCILGAKAAKKIPQFNKDAIIILGCQIKKDGTLTKLLKSRVDRAIEFSKMQKEATGKEILFVPSGGKGEDEIISEAQAMKNYLIEQGIKEESILIEDKSTNTYENIKFSNKIIKERIENAKIAFSTTNYHVFRAGIIANNQNIEAEGIGAKTKSYYWINAFIREFIATIVSEKRNNLKTIILLMIIQLVFSVAQYVVSVL